MTLAARQAGAWIDGERPGVGAAVVPFLVATAALSSLSAVTPARAALALGIAQRGVVLKGGVVVRQGSAAGLLADPELSSLMGG